MINERIKKLRKKENLTQEEFAKKIKMSRSNYTSIETGKQKITERNIKIICEQFNVNEDWLINGTGDMFINSESQKIEEIYKENELNSFDKMFIENYIKLNKDERKAVEKFIKGLIK